MKSRRLGENGPAVSALGLGCTGIGSAAGARYPEEMMKSLNI